MTLKQESRSIPTIPSSPPSTLKTQESPVAVSHSASPVTSHNPLASSHSFTPPRSLIGAISERLARVTAYWAGEGDYYTGRLLSATGVRLHGGHCAVDPSIIPYGSVVEIAGVGKYLAVDTGSAVVSRAAAREAGHNSEERNALVIDIFFESRSDGENFAANGPKFASISWYMPTTTGIVAKEARSLFAQENWSKIESKQL